MLRQFVYNLMIFFSQAEYIYISIFITNIRDITVLATYRYIQGRIGIKGKKRSLEDKEKNVEPHKSKYMINYCIVNTTNTSNKNMAGVENVHKNGQKCF